MKDITRIHIAKVAYDIELPAKKKLEAYIAQLEAYAQDAGVLEDIEIRITELLQERGIKQNNVIASADVVAVTEQLGDPKEFMTDGDVVVDELPVETRKRLYRNTDTALVGGVLSGFASYFGISPIWTRLAFVVLTFFSLGLSVFAYVLFWFIVPPARTAAEKLSMTGKSVTLASIRALNNEEGVVNTTPRTVRKIVLALVGIGSVLAAVGVIAAGIYGIFGINQVSEGRTVQEMLASTLGSNYLLTIGLGALAAAILVIFLILVAYAAFKQNFGKRIWITAIVLVIAGLTTFGAAVGSAAYGTYDLSVQAAKSIVTTSVKVPAGFENVTSLSVKNVSYNAKVEYIVSTQPRIELISPLKDSVSMSIEGEKAVLNYKKDANKEADFRYGTQSIIRVYGPALKTIDAEAVGIEYNGAAQDVLSVIVKNSGSVQIVGSRIETVNANIDNASDLNGQSSTIGKVVAELSRSSTMSLGTVTSLTIKASTTCAVESHNEVRAAKVNDGFVTLNDKKIINTQYEESCMIILSAGDNEFGTQFDN